MSVSAAASCQLLLLHNFLPLRDVVSRDHRGLFGGGSSLGQRNGRLAIWVDLAGIDPRDQTQGI